MGLFKGIEVPVKAADSHSLWYFFTLTMGQTQMSEFVAVGMVDDIQVEYYNSEIGKIISRRHWHPGSEVEEATNKSWDTYDDQDVVVYNMKSHSWTLLIPQVVIDMARLQATKFLTENFYQPLCGQILKSYLLQERNRLMRRVKPKVRVFQKKSGVSGGTEVVCLATGFYPRAVEVTVLRDGHPIPEQELRGGEVLPNGDGTYQLRKSLRVSEEEQSERRNYPCRVQHSGLDNKLEVNWVLTDPEPDVNTGLIAGVVIGVLTVALLLPVSAFVLWRKKRQGERERKRTERHFFQQLLSLKKLYRPGEKLYISTSTPLMRTSSSRNGVTGTRVRGRAVRNATISTRPTSRVWAAAMVVAPAAVELTEAETPAPAS
ncbi:BOLA class I histocompatibility antigen, alpha chain BL3-7-like [Lepisosteus oculatus]|uniref:BOLA class I histocompatibility antigen, alpha chain BL3-7-like n=1 Tax=Lepisosteus oculatus TaxID=7918 RepID=UPI0035F507CF